MSASQEKQTRWREVSGTILKSEVRFDGEDYRPIIEYEYQIDGATHRGDRIVIGPLIQFNWKGPSTRLVERYPVGSTVIVYVDTRNPRRAALQPYSDSNLPWFLVSFSAIALVLVALAVKACGAH